MTALTKATNQALTPIEVRGPEQDLEGFVELCDELDPLRYHVPHYRPLEELRAIQAARPALQARWAAVDRPVNDDEIAAEMLRTMAALAPNTSRADVGAFIKVVSQDIAERQPPVSVYVLQRACRLYRQKHKFLSEAELFSEIKRAERCAEHYRYRLLEFPLERYIAKQETAEEEERQERQDPCFIGVAKIERRRALSEWYAWRHLQRIGWDQESLFACWFGRRPFQSKREALKIDWEIVRQRVAEIEAEREADED